MCNDFYSQFKKGVRLILVSLQPFSSGALKELVRCLATLRLTSGKTVESPCKDGEAQEDPALPASSCLNLSSPGDRPVRGASKMQPQLPSNYNGMGKPQVRATQLSPINPPISKQNRLLLMFKLFFWSGLLCSNRQLEKLYIHQ